MDALIELTKPNCTLKIDGDNLFINDMKFCLNDASAIYAGETPLNYQSIYTLYSSTKLSEAKVNITQSDVVIRPPLFRSIRAFFDSKDISVISQIVKFDTQVVTEIDLFKFPSTSLNNKRGGDQYKLEALNMNDFGTSNLNSEIDFGDLNEKYNSLEQAESFLSNTHVDLYEIAKTFKVAHTYHMDQTIGAPIILVPRVINNAPITIDNFFTQFINNVNATLVSTEMGRSTFQLHSKDISKKIILCDDIQSIHTSEVSNVCAAILTGEEDWFTSDRGSLLSNDPTSFFKHICGFLIFEKGFKPNLNWNCTDLVFSSEHKNYAELGIIFTEKLKHFLSSNNPKLIDNLW